MPKWVLCFPVFRLRWKGGLHMPQRVWWSSTKYAHLTSWFYFALYTQHNNCNNIHIRLYTRCILIITRHTERRHTKKSPEDISPRSFWLSFYREHLWKRILFCIFEPSINYMSSPQDVSTCSTLMPMWPTLPLALSFGWMWMVLF